METETLTHSTLSLESQIEGFLFWKAETVSIKEIAKVFAQTNDAIDAALDTLKNNLLSRGIALIQAGDSVELRTAPSMSVLIEQLTKEELNKDLGKAGLETLSIILYEGPISRKDIDYIRGVNSQFIVRNLLVRGLIERLQGEDARSFLYKPTTELFAYLGIHSEKQLPEYAQFKEEVQRFKTNNEPTTHDTVPA